MRGMAAGAIATVVLIFAPSAQAAQRYAAPSGTGTECTQANPCSLNEAVGAAKAGDEVILTPGTYGLVSPLFTPPVTNVQIHGDGSGPMPRIAVAFGGPALYMTQAGDSLSYLEIENDSNGGLGVLCVGGRLERIRVRAVGTFAAGVYAGTDCTIRNSLFRVEGSESGGVRAFGSAGKTSAGLRGVTAIASGSLSVGAMAEYNEGTTGEFTLEIQNSILQGGEADLKATSGLNGPGNISVTHSNFDTSKPEGSGKVIDGGGNQSAAPLFVNAEGGDYREAAGSPTIDAGLAGELGPLDLAGNARVQGSAPDIGAYEFTPPPPAAAAGGVRSISIKPKRFRAAAKGGPVAARVLKGNPPTGAAVTYTTTGPATVQFSVSRRVHKKHGKKTSYAPIKGSFTETAVAGSNHFVFSGRIGGRALKPGAYKLTAFAGHLVSAAFTIVR